MPLSLLGLGVLLGGTGGGPGALVVHDLNFWVNKGKFANETIEEGGIGIVISDELAKCLLPLSSSLVRV